MYAAENLFEGDVKYMNSRGQGRLNSRRASLGGWMAANGHAARSGRGGPRGLLETGTKLGKTRKLARTCRRTSPAHPVLCSRGNPLASAASSICSHPVLSRSRTPAPEDALQAAFQDRQPDLNEQVGAAPAPTHQLLLGQVPGR